MAGCRQYVIASAKPTQAAPESFAAAQLRAARDRIAHVPYDLIGTSHVFYLHGAAPDVRKARARAGVDAAELQGKLFTPEALRGWERTVHAVGEQIEAARRSEPGTWYAVRPAPGAAGILATGVDTLYASFWTSIDPETVEVLEAMRTIAREGDTKVFVAHGRLIWEVLGYGSHPFCVILQGASSAIKIKRSPSTKTNPQVQVEFRSAWLWRDGPDRCVQTISGMLRRWTAEAARGHFFRVTVTRVDLAVDVSSSSLNLDGTELGARRFLTRARSKSQFYKGRLTEMQTSEAAATRAQKRAARAHAEKAFDTASEFSQHWQGLTYTGLALGRSELGARIYRKDVELARPGVHKPYMRALWRSRGWDGEPVWRVEFTILGSALRKMTATARGAVDVEIDEHLRPNGIGPNRLVVGNDWRGVRLALGGLWAYMSQRWLTLRDPLAKNKQRTRWPVNAGWRALWCACWDLGGATNTKLVEVRRFGKVRAETMTVRPAPLGVGYHGPIQQTHVEAMNARPGAWVDCQPLAPAGDLMERVLDVDGRAQLGEWGWGPSAVEDAEDLDVEVTAAESRLAQMWPQLVGCFVKVGADLHLSGIERPAIDEVMQRLFCELPDDFEDRVQAKAAATALDAYRLTQIRRAAA